MTQRSQPAQDHINNYPTSDAGPYSADEWSDMFACLFAAGEADQGPIVRYLNELEVTDDGADIDVDTGAAVIDGHWFKNDASLAFTIPHPAANPRIDRVVVAVNNTAIAYSVSDLGFALDTPDDLTDYGGTASIEPYSARLCIVQGAEAGAPVAPGLDQNANHFMIPLYQYQISVAGAITVGTDQRDWAFFGSTIGNRSLFVPALSGYNSTDALVIDLTDIFALVANVAGPAVILADSKICYAFGRFACPADYYRNMSIKSVLVGGNGGDVVISTQSRWGACGEAANTHSQSTASLTEATEATAWNFSCHATLDLATDPQPLDIITLYSQRNATVGADTVNADLYHLGWIVEYEAKS